MACIESECRKCGFYSNSNIIWTQCPCCGSTDIGWAYDDYETGDDDDTSEEVSEL